MQRCRDRPVQAQQLVVYGAKVVCFKRIGSAVRVLNFVTLTSEQEGELRSCRREEFTTRRVSVAALRGDFVRALSCPGPWFCTRHRLYGG